MMKYFFTLTLLALGLMAQAQIPSYVPTNGLVGWWPFNGNANDESGNGNHGTVNGATLAVDRFGNAGKAYSFDGANSSIGIKKSTSLTITNSISICGWIYRNTPSSNRADAIFGSSCFLPSSGGYFLRVIDKRADIGISLPYNETFSNQLIDTSKWFFIVGAYNNLESKIYINGSLNNSKIVGLGNLTTWSSNDSLRIGQETYPGAPNGYHIFDGLLDDIAIYNRALSASEVQQLYLGCQTQPTFTAQPQNKSVAQGQTTTFAVQVDSASSFQWQMNQGYGQNWVNLSNSAQISGVTTNSLTVEGRYQIDGAQFRCIATSCNADTSNAATLTVTSSATSAAGTIAGVPGLINYQGSALDSARKPMKNQTISLKLSVLDSSSTGAAVFVESHSAATNGSGHFAIQIGGGTALLGTFDSVGWANGRNKYLKTELSQNGTWVSLGTSQLVSVPYALVSGRSLEANRAYEATTLRDSAGNVFSVGYSNGQPTLVAAPGSGSASNPGSFACGQSVTYAGESYPTVQIGNQCWFQKNLNVGTMIQGANDQTNNSILEKYCYNNDPSNCAIYGGLYQWAEAVQYQNGASNTTSPSPAFSGNVKGICPTGWHMPSDGEWCTLTTFLDSMVDCTVFGWTGTNVGGKMKSTSNLWNSPNTGATNSSGFSSLPGGYRPTNGTITFNFIGINPTFWSSYESSSTNALFRLLNNDLSNIYRSFNLKNYGFSVRCLED